MFEFEKGVPSHMPFAAPDPENGFAPREFCCLSVGGKWKIHQFRNGAWSRVATGLPDDATECSPAAEFLDGKWQLTFIGGGAKKARMFRLYHICDLDAGVLPVTVCPADVGYLQKFRLVSASRHGPLVIEDPNTIRRVEFRDAEYLYRVTYDPFNPRRLLISGQLFGGEIFSRVYVPGTGELYSLSADGVPAYKAFFWHDLCFYARRVGRGFEEREIARAEQFTLTPLDPGGIVTQTQERNFRKTDNHLEDFE